MDDIERFSRLIMDRFTKLEDEFVHCDMKSFDFLCFCFESDPYREQVRTHLLNIYIFFKYLLIYGQECGGRFKSERLKFNR